MQRKALLQWLLTGLMTILITALAASAMAAEKTVIGKVNDNYQIVTDSQIYEIDNTEKGKELAENHVGAKVEATGTVAARDDMKILTVVSFKVLAE
ncbi:MAG: hypothetical protein HY911_12035 [Desulfobacterales bacterium]|nr:hypothetical protein [Desulfobacterales bacterium]